VVLDSPSRENEGDLIIAAAAITTEKMAFMVRHTSGIICAPLPAHLAASLDLPQMLPPAQNSDPNSTAYTISIDAAHDDVTTGISAHDRALTCQLLADQKAKPATFRRPGHVFPLRARDGGVLERQGHTEAAVDFCRLAGRGQVGVISEIVDDGDEVAGTAERVGGGMLRGAGCVAFAKRFGLKVCTVEGLVEYRRRTEGKANGN